MGLRAGLGCSGGGCGSGGKLSWSLVGTLLSSIMFSACRSAEVVRSIQFSCSAYGIFSTSIRDANRSLVFD